MEVCLEYVFPVLCNAVESSKHNWNALCHVNLLNPLLLLARFAICLSVQSHALAVYDSSDEVSSEAGTHQLHVTALEF